MLGLNRPMPSDCKAATKTLAECLVCGYISVEAEFILDGCKRPCYICSDCYSRDDIDISDVVILIQLGACSTRCSNNLIVSLRKKIVGCRQLTITKRTKK